VSVGYHTSWTVPEEHRADPAYVEAGAAIALGQAVYDRRTALGLDQASLARRAGLTTDDIDRIEGGGNLPHPPASPRSGHGTRRRAGRVHRHRRDPPLVHPARGLIRQEGREAPPPAVPGQEPVRLLRTRGQDDDGPAARPSRTQDQPQRRNPVAAGPGTAYGRPHG
jgi:hypothetical protein